jgi:hypothetical protein
MIGLKKQQYCFVKSMNDNAIATLNFGIVRHFTKGHIYVNVVVGMFYKNIEDLYAKLSGNTNVYFKATTGLQIGYLMPEQSFKEWDFNENIDNTDLFNEIFNCIQKYAFAYYKKMQHIKEFAIQLQDRDKHVLGGIDIYLPILYYLNGEKQKGLECIAAAIEKKKNPKTNEEIRGEKMPEEVVILRAGESNATADDMQKMLDNVPSGGSIIIVGAKDSGEIDPMYLKFVENYKELPFV